MRFRAQRLSNDRDLVRRPVLPSEHLAGDSVFPGQCTLATALGGRKTADVLVDRMPQDR